MKTSVNDIIVEYDLEGYGQPFVLLHGGQGDRETFDNIFPDLAKKFTVLNFDQRGSGNSSKPDAEYTISQIADDTAALMEEVGFEKAHVFGVSMGGLIAEALAIEHPSKVQSVILGCTLPGSWEHTIKMNHSEDVAVAFSTDESLDPKTRAQALARTAFAPGYMERHPEIVEILIEQRRNKPIDKTGLGHRLAAVRTFAAYDQLSQITCPALIITGKEDQLVDWHNSHLLKEKIPQAKLVTLEQAGHLFWVEQKEKTLDAIFQFISNHEL